MTQAPLSKRNSEVARLRGLARQRAARHEAGRFVVEGTKLVGEALASDLAVLDVYADEAWQMPGDLAEALAQADVPTTRLAAGGIERIASTTSPQPVVAEVMLPDLGWKLTSDETVLVAVDLNDPGNVGTLARAAVAAGFDAIVVLGSTADPFGPKAIRASAGALFRLPVVLEPDIERGMAQLGEIGIERVGTRMLDAEPCDRSDLAGPVAIVLGSEAHGLDGATAQRIDRWVSVPMAGAVESLNVAMAGAILTYEVARQRR